MVFSLFRRATPRPMAAPQRASVDQDLCVYAIGDIHGRDDLFAQLLERIDHDIAARAPARARIILLGDLIDRGAASAQVIDRCLTRDWGGVSADFIAGNHEELMLMALGGDLDALRVRRRAGGDAAILSYGVPERILDRGIGTEILRALTEQVPHAHLAFLNAMVDHVAIGDYWFVHAGIKPGVALEQQRPEHLRWIRSEFLNSRAPHPAIVVHGHTVTRDVDEQRNRIGIDTGAYASGMLTAIGLQGGERWYLRTSAPQTTPDA
jgi:serine/threonine protein phosphatase 1